MAKKKFDGDKIKENIKFLLSCILLVLGVVIVFVSLYLPPEGVIDSSVLTLIGENFVFVGAVWGLGMYTSVQKKKIDAHYQHIKQLNRDEDVGENDEEDLLG